MKLTSYLIYLSLITVCAVAIAKTDLPPMTNAQLSLNVTQEGVPVPSGGDKMNLVRVTLKKIGPCDGKVKINAYFRFFPFCCG